MLTLYKSLILNILEYCCPLWSPHRIQDIAKIEAVQRRFTSKISAVANLNYWDRLKALRMFSLQRRRERYLLIYLWKIINGKVPNDVGITWHNHIRRGVVVDIPRIPSTVTKINSACDNFFTVKAAKLWNCIPSCVNTKTSLLTFKANLDCFLLDVPDCPPVAGYTTVLEIAIHCLPGNHPQTDYNIFCTVFACVYISYCIYILGHVYSVIDSN
jgi:hypothetical protein